MPFNKKHLRQYNKISLSIINELNQFFGKLQQNAYKETYLLSHPVLSRNPFTNRMFKRCLFDEWSSKPFSKKRLIKNLFRYYKNSFIIFSRYLSNVISFRLARYKFDRSTLNQNRALYVVDIFVLVERALKSMKFEDLYFNGLYEILEKYGQQFVILPTFIGNISNPKLKGIIDILKKHPSHFLTEFELLLPLDYFRILHFILFYPIKNLVFTFQLKKGKLENIFLDETISTLPHNQFDNFVRYLVGARLAKVNKNIRLISWYENQVIDKNLYRGLRDGGIKSRIYGNQTFIYCPTQMNYKPIMSEKQKGLVPDVILLNGPYYFDMVKDLELEVRLGPSLRYNGIFNIDINWDKKRHTLILLSYYLQECFDILEMIKVMKEPMLIKPHPTHTDNFLHQFSRSIPDKCQFTDKETYNLIEESNLVLSSGSGTPVEAAAMGTSVIIVANQSSFTTNPMPELGQGEIWEIVFDQKDLKATVERLINYRNNHIDRIKSIAKEIKASFFTQPTEANIVQAFDLMS